MNRIGEDNTTPVEEREILDTKQMVEDSFFSNLEKIKKGGMSSIRPETKVAITQIKQDKPDPINTSTLNTEKLLLSLYEVRDDLIEAFGGVDINSVVAKNINNVIIKTGKCIKDIGGEVEEFNPLDHVSGLQVPSLVKNAERVIENTKSYYTLGKVDDAKISPDGKTINVIFSGAKNGIKYTASGTIKANKMWVGNEAIDYIYTQASGKLSVKSPNESGNWINRNQDFDIAWSLSEVPEKKEEIKGDTEKDISNDFSVEEK